MYLHPIQINGNNSKIYNNNKINNNNKNNNTNTTPTTTPTTNPRSSRSTAAARTFKTGPYFKPEFSGKPDEDAEAHLLHANDWMNTHCFIDGVKVQRFSLTLLGEARLMVPLIRTYKCRLA